MPRLWLTGFLAALALTALGVWLGEPAQTLRNAADVCLACVGIG